MDPSKILIPEGLDTKLLKINDLNGLKRELRRFAGALLTLIKE
jgi:hypothetical protein